MAKLDTLLDLGRNYSTRLSLMAAIVPIAWAEVNPPFPIGPNLYLHLKHGLGLLPIYTNPDEIAEFFEGEGALEAIMIGRHAYIARDEIAAVLPPEHYQKEENDLAEKQLGFRPRSYVRIFTGGMIMPCEFEAAVMIDQMKRALGGYFGE